jgi:hypothetical protein
MGCFAASYYRAGFAEAEQGRYGAPEIRVDEPPLTGFE